jgi:hypothetical protein
VGGVHGGRPFLMKNKPVLSALLFLSALTGVFAQGSQATPVTPVVIESENKLLSRSYVQAFGVLVRPPFTLTMQRENIMYVLEDVRGVKEAGGLLVVEVGRGFNYIVNPKDVVAISDGPAVRGDR